MLILARHEDERIIIDGGKIIITVCEIVHGKVRLGIDAPDDVRIDREEIHREREREAGRR